MWTNCGRLAQQVMLEHHKVYWMNWQLNLAVRQVTSQGGYSEEAHPDHPLRGTRAPRTRLLLQASRHLVRLPILLDEQIKEGCLLMSQISAFSRSNALKRCPFSA